MHFPTWLLGLVIVGVCVGISLGGVVLVRRSVKLSDLEEHHDVAGFILAWWVSSTRCCSRSWW
ncbi:hypothetical protein [Solirubrobacter ginsenosidimutans]|uniref:hypothetical protein n=1 Tax=Solirubrobacter ginsenosidimutans TaxID=490573 RepID=UPI0022CDEC28|nr:hypothetical protein [Solirubrobacter ginsenosidimutans]